MVCIEVCLWKHVYHRSDSHCPWLLVHPAPGHRSSPAEHQRRQALHCTLRSWNEIETSTSSRWSIPGTRKFTEVIWHPKAFNLLFTIDLGNGSADLPQISGHLRLGVRRILGISEPSRIGLADLGVGSTSVTSPASRQRRCERQTAVYTGTNIWYIV